MSGLQRVVHGRPYAPAMLEQLSRWDAHRVVLATNSSLLQEGRLAHEVRDALGTRCTDLVGGLHAHAPRDDVLRLVRALRHSAADALVGLGGGSVTSAVKVARLALANGVDDVDGFERLIRGDGIEAPCLPCIMLPTTLSAGEFTDAAGVTDLRTHRKQAISHASLAPDVVILDPHLTRDTPPALWAGTAIRALDHVVETWCSVEATPLSDATSLHGLRLLLRGLQSGDRLLCQQGAWLAVQGIAAGVPQGASHGIGHALGGVAGVGHGDTSCVMLPHVLRFNAPVNAARQAELAAFWGAADERLDALVESQVGSMGLPRALRETGIAIEVLPDVARAAMTSPWVKRNPRPFDGVEQMLALLREAW